ncbi:hypothetical protein ACIGCZ_32930 [Streptomyces nigra]
MSAVRFVLDRRLRRVPQMPGPARRPSLTEPVFALDPFGPPGIEVN